MKPQQPAAKGYVWVKVLSGPNKGEWAQVLRREYEPVREK